MADAYRCACATLWRKWDAQLRSRQMNSVVVRGKHTNTRMRLNGKNDRYWPRRHTDECRMSRKCRCKHMTIVLARRTHAENKCCHCERTHNRTISASDVKLKITKQKYRKRLDSHRPPPPQLSHASIDIFFIDTATIPVVRFAVNQFWSEPPQSPTPVFAMFFDGMFRMWIRQCVVSMNCRFAINNHVNCVHDKWNAAKRAIALRHHTHAHELLLLLLLEICSVRLLFNLVLLYKSIDFVHPFVFPADGLNAVFKVPLKSSAKQSSDWN